MFTRADIVRRCIKGMRELINIACGFEGSTPSKWYRVASIHELLSAVSAVSAHPCYAPEVCARLLSLKSEDSGSVDEAGSQNRRFERKRFSSAELHPS